MDDTFQREQPNFEHYERVLEIYKDWTAPLDYGEPIEYEDLNEEQKLAYDIEKIKKDK